MSDEVRLARSVEWPALVAVRREVFVVGQGVPVEIELDDLDATAEHAVACVDGAVVGTGRLVAGRIDEAGELVGGTDGTVATIGRMAVLDSARGQGLGRRLLDLLVARADERGLPAVELHAQVHARGFYEAAGFVAAGPVYLEAGIEHIGMRRRVGSAAAPPPGPA